MKLELKNICSIYQAQMRFDGLTILAGKNNTGKSTIGKSLFSIFNSIRYLDTRRKNEIRSRMYNVLEKINIQALHFPKDDELLKALINLRNNIDIINFEVVEKTVKNGINGVLYDNDEFENTVNEIIKILKYDDKYYNNIVVNKVLNDEFNEKISSVICDNINSEISVYFKENKEKPDTFNYKDSIVIKNDSVNEVMVEQPIVHNVLYYDFLNVDYNLELNPYLLQKERFNHKYHFDKKINFKDKNYIGDDEATIINIDEYFKKFGYIGEVYVENREVYYKEKNYREPISPKNLSQGLKSIIVLRQMFINNLIDKKDLLIFDEPETNLHPEYQVILADLICHIIKDLDLTVLICSHSFDFINALHHFSNEYGILKNNNYYLSEKDNNINIIRHVDSINSILENLYGPTGKLEGLLYE